VKEAWASQTPIQKIMIQSIDLHRSSWWQFRDHENWRKNYVPKWNDNL